MNDEPRNQKKSWTNYCLSSSCVGFFLLVILAILFPNPHPHEAALKTSCLSNLKQIGLGINMYMADWDNKFPAVSGFGPELDEHKALWGARGDVFSQQGAKRRYLLDLIYPYVKNAKMFICPAVGENAIWKVPDGKVNLRNNSYIFNAWCVKDSTQKPPAGCMQIAGQHATICKSPADAPLVWDAISGYGQFAHEDTKHYVFHSYSINLLYADWHVGTRDMNADKPPFNATKGRQGHFWGAPDPNRPGGTLGAVGWSYKP